MLDKIISASLLGCDLSDLKNEIRKAENSGVDWIHFDVMDGTFVKNISFGEPVLKAIKPHVTTFVDTHLMITDPLRYISNYADLGSDLITFHYEAAADCQAVIDAIHAKNKMAGISIKPDTPVSAIEKYIPQVQMVLVMTVNPGFGGQSFIPETVDKVRQVRKIVDDNGYNCRIQVDGGIKAETADIVKNAGADCLVSGSYIFSAEDMSKAVFSLR